MARLWRCLIIFKIGFTSGPWSVSDGDTITIDPNLTVETKSVVMLGLELAVIAQSRIVDGNM